MRSCSASLLALLVLPLALAACGSGSSAGDTTPPPAAAGGKPPTVSVANSGLGKILVDADGRTLYLYEKESGATSACNAGCAALWPPLSVTGKPVAGDGVDATLLGTTTRTDGSRQATYAGHPLYRYAKDTQAGDTRGEAVGNVWYAVDAEGGKVEQGSSSGGGYGY